MFKLNSNKKWESSQHAVTMQVICNEMLTAPLN